MPARHEKRAAQGGPSFVVNFECKFDLGFEASPAGPHPSVKLEWAPLQIRELRSRASGTSRLP